MENYHVKLRIPLNQFQNAKSYLEENGYQIEKTKLKPGDEVVIVANKINSIYRMQHWQFSEENEYQLINDKFKGRAQMICFENIKDL